MEQLLETILSDDSWIVNGKYTLRKMGNDYVISEKINAGYKKLYSFGNLTEALKRYVELSAPNEEDSINGL